MDFILDEFKQFGLTVVFENELENGRKYLSYNKYQFVICYFIYNENLKSEYCVWTGLVYYLISDEKFNSKTFYDIYRDFCINYSSNKFIRDSSNKYFVLSNYYVKIGRFQIDEIIDIIHTMYLYDKIPNHKSILHLNDNFDKFDKFIYNINICANTSKIIYYLL